MKIYLSGPMSGFPGGNRLLFNKAATSLRVQGHDVLNPAESSAQYPGQSRSFYMDVDLRAILGRRSDDRVDAVAVLPDWHQSRGARLEVEVALEVGIAVLWADTLQPLTVQDFLDAREWPQDNYLLPHGEVA